MFSSTTLNIHLYSDYYSEDNKKTEYTNQTLEQYFHYIITISKITSLNSYPL